jgi:hypothetical protein
MLNDKNFEMLMADIAQRRKDGDREARTVLSPMRWTKKDGIKERRKDSVYFYQDALDVLKVAEASLPGVPADNEDRLLRKRIETVRGEIYNSLVRVTGSEEFKARSEQAAERAEKLVNDAYVSSAAERAKSRPLTSGSWPACRPPRSGP